MSICMWTTQTHTKKQLKNAFDHLNVTTFFRHVGKDICDHRGRILAGLWIPRDYHWPIYALSAEGYVKFVFIKTALWSAVTEGFAPTSWVSHFSGCHNSSCNIRHLTSAIWNMVARLWSTSACPFCPVLSRFEHWIGQKGERRWEYFSENHVAGVELGQKNWSFVFLSVC